MVWWYTKKSKYSRPDKVSIHRTRGMSTANLDWCTSSNDGASGVAYLVEYSNKSGSKMLDNDSADRTSDERA